MHLAQMTAHHRGAIDMAPEEVADGENPQALEMAQKVIEAWPTVSVVVAVASPCSPSPRTAWT